MMINNNLIAEAKTRIQATSSTDIIMVNNETNVNNDNHGYNNDVGGDENVLALDEAVVDVDHNNIKANNNNNNTVANQIVASTTSSPLPTQPPPTLSSSSTTSQHLLLSQPTKPNTNANPVSNTKSSSLKTVCGGGGGGFSRKNNINHKAHTKKQKNLNVDFNKNNVDKFKRNSILASLSSSFNTNHSIHLGSNDGNSNNETAIDENITLNRRNADDNNNINESSVVPSLNSAPDSTINEMIIHHNNASTNNGNNNNSINDHHLHNPPHQIFNPQLHQKQKNNNNNNEMIAQVANDPILSAYPNMDLNSETLGITKRTVIIHKDSRGYGMRISGDNPVFIQHVNEEGAAYKAGVRSGDQIIKVNGTLVTKLGHADVVRMIQSCGSFVGLTLLSKPPSSTTSVLGPTSSSSSSALDSNNRSQSHNLNASPADSPTPPTQQPSSTTMIPLIPNVSPTIQPVAFAPIFPIAAAMFPSNNNNNNPIRITGPQPVPVSTQQQFHENSIKTLKEMIQDEQRHLEELKLMRSSPVEVERCQKRINDMKLKLDMHQNNLSTFTTNNQTTTTTFGAGGSHSRQQSFDDDFRNSTLLSQNNNSCSGMTTPRIMPMDEDIDMDPDNSVYHQQKYEYIDDLEPTPFDSRDIGVISKPITKSVSNPTQPIMLRSSANGQQANNKDKVKRDSKILMAIAEQIASSSTSPPLPPSSIKWWSHLETDSLRICRYFIQKMVPPNQLLFYVMAKTVFPQIFTLSFHNKAQVIKRWAYQLISTFVTKDSPLFMQEFPPDYLERFDQNLNALIVANPSATDVVASPFDPFIISIQEVVRKQREEFVQMTQRQRLTSTPNPKHELQSTIEMLLTTHSHIAQPQQIASPSIGGNNIQAKLDLRDMDSILDIFIQHVKQNQAESTMALISSLLAIGRYIFKLNPSKHCLLLESSGGGNGGTLSSTASNVLPLTNIAVPSSLNPLLKLSDTTSNSKKSNPKRNSMIPIGSRSFSSVSPFLGNSFDSSTSSSASSSLSSTIPNHGTQAMVIEDYSHCFVPIVEMDHIMYCTSCMLPMWGDPYTLKCTKCLMHTHLWCRKHAAANNPCNNDTHHHQHQNSTSSQSGKQSNRRAKSEKKSVLERFTGKRNNKPRSDSSQVVPIASSVSRTSSFSSTTSTDSNSSSEGMDSDAEQINFSSTSNTMTMAKHDEDVESSNTTSVVAETCMQNPEVPVNRSGSFVQRKKKKSSTSIGSPRKRSDPALTSKQISTISGNGHGGVTGAGTLPQLTSARSSGALMNSASVGAHDSQFRTITGQRAKHLTSSDSSLMSATTVASKMKSAPSSSGMTNMFANNDSNKSSSTNLTSTSSPRRTRHRNTNDSAIQMDGSSDDELNDFEPCNEKSNEESNDGNDVTPPPLPSSSSFSHSPPPLPPRPDSQTEKRRQIQMEIIQTEEEHYEVLRYIRKVYQKPLKTEKLLSDEQMDIIFGNVRKLRRIHRSIFAKLSAASKNQLQSINSDPYMLEKAIHEIFCGDLGKKLETEASKFCVNRKIRNGIELWNSKKKDSRLRALVDSDSRTRSMPDNPLARLGLDDLLSRVFQRPLRYPLLFERLSKSTPKDSPGYRYLEEVLVCCRRSGEKINEATKKAELKARFAEIIRKTDFSSFSNPSLINNLEQHELLHEGPLVWRITKTKLVEVLLILTDQIILVLTRDSSDRNRYSLRSHNNPTQINKVKLGYRPDIKMDDLLMRDVATDHAAFFLVSRSQDIIYEFAATTSNERNKWKEVITKAINEYREKHPSIADLQQQKSFTSTRSMTMMDLKTSQMQSNDDVSPPPLPPPSILNRPLPKPPESSSPPPPPPPLPPPSSSFINRPLPKPPIDSEQTQPAPPSSSHQSRYDGSIRVVSANDLRPSSVDLVPFSQVQVSPNYRGVSHLEHSTRTKSNDLREINDNIKNLIQEGRRSGGVHLEDLEREIQEMSMVYDVAKHDADSKETLSRLITDMFRKATEWSYHFVQNDEPAKCELSQRVRNSVESFVKSYIDSNFILPLPDDGDQVDECPDSLFVDDAARANNENSDVVDGAQESLITSMASCQLAAADPVQTNVVRRSFSDKSNKSDKPQETGLDSSHNNNSNNLNENEDQNQIIGNIDAVEDSDVQLIDSSPQKKSSPSPNPFDQASSTPPRSISSSSPISAVQQTSSSKSSNPFLNNNTNPDNESNITTMVHGNLEISSIGMAEFVALSENSDDDDDDGGGGHGNILNETQTNLDNDDILRNSSECGQNDESKSSDNQNDWNFDLNHDQSLDQTVEQSSVMSNLNKDISSTVENDFSKESSSIASPRSSSKKKTKSHTYLI